MTYMSFSLESYIIFVNGVHEEIIFEFVYSFVYQSLNINKAHLKKGILLESNHNNKSFIGLYTSCVNQYMTNVAKVYKL